MTILLVDSDKNALDREACRLARQQPDAMVFMHSSAEDAVRFVMYHNVDVVYTRSVLKEMTGQELIDRIHRFCPNAEFHILLKDEVVPIPCRQKEEPGLNCDVVPGNRKQSEKNTNVNREAGEKSSARYFHLVCQDTKEQKKGGKPMTDQKLQSLNRKELLEMLIEQGKELEFLKSEYEKDLEFLKEEHRKESEALRKELEEAKRALKNRELVINEAGSIAVAALQLNGIFEAAQAASQQYIENIRSLNERQDAICAKREADSRAEMERRLIETKEKCESLEAACQRKCAAMEEEAKQRSEAYWAEVSKRLQSFYESHQELKKLLNFGGSGIQF